MSSMQTEKTYLSSVQKGAIPVINMCPASIGRKSKAEWPWRDELLSVPVAGQLTGIGTSAGWLLKLPHAALQSQWTIVSSADQEATFERANWWQTDKQPSSAPPLLVDECSLISLVMLLWIAAWHKTSLRWSRISFNGHFQNIGKHSHSGLCPLKTTSQPLFVCSCSKYVKGKNKPLLAMQWPLAANIRLNKFVESSSQQGCEISNDDNMGSLLIKISTTQAKSFIWILPLFSWSESQPQLLQRLADP